MLFRFFSQLLQKGSAVRYAFKLFLCDQALYFLVLKATNKEYFNCFYQPWSSRLCL